MKLLGLEGLDTADFAISDISAIYQTPAWSSISMHTDSGRKLNGFLLIDSGDCVYEWADGSAELSRGSLIYLPKGSKHTVTVTKRPFSFYRISFCLTDLASGEHIIFSEAPSVITSSAGGRLFELSRELMSTTVSRSGLLKSISHLAELLHTAASHASRTQASRISPAVEYLDSHFSENTSVDYLAQLCYISRPHLFRLFREELGMSPIEYRNTLRIERAKTLLLDGECTVSEIASMLGFEGSYYFSRIFKQYTGVAPSRYGAGRGGA